MAQPTYYVKYNDGRPTIRGLTFAQQQKLLREANAPAGTADLTPNAAVKEARDAKAREAVDTFSKDAATANSLQKIDVSKIDDEFDLPTKEQLDADQAAENFFAPAGNKNPPISARESSFRAAANQNDSEAFKTLTEDRYNLPYNPGALEYPDEGGYNGLVSLYGVDDAIEPIETRAGTMALSDKTAADKLSRAQSTLAALADIPVAREYLKSKSADAKSEESARLKKESLSSADQRAAKERANKVYLKNLGITSAQTLQEAKDLADLEIENLKLKSKAASDSTKATQERKYNRE